MVDKIPQQPIIDSLISLFREQEGICFAFLFGSRARNQTGANSDWDIAIWFKDNSDQFSNLGFREEIRSEISRCLQVPVDQVDIVDLYRADLSISASVIGEGVPLLGDDTLEMARYYQRIWALMEDNYSRAATV